MRSLPAVSLLLAHAASLWPAPARGVRATLPELEGGMAGGDIQVVRGRHGLFAVHRKDMYIGHSLAVYGEWSEGEYTDVFGRCIKEGDVVLDIGANIGAFTVPMAKRAGVTGTVHAFEPMGLNMRLLSTNAVLNGLRNVELHKVFAVGPEEAGGVSHTTEFTDTHFLSGHSARLLNYGSYSRKHAAIENGTHTIPHLTVDQLRLERCDFIKMDIEGAELAVLRGAADTIARFAPIIYSEVDEDAEMASAVVQHLRGLGYSCYLHEVPLHNEDNFNGAVDGIPEFYSTDAGVVCSRMYLCATKSRKLPLGVPAGDLYKINWETSRYEKVVNGTAMARTLVLGKEARAAKAGAAGSP